MAEVVSTLCTCLIGLSTYPPAAARYLVGVQVTAIARDGEDHPLLSAGALAVEDDFAGTERRRAAHDGADIAGVLDALEEYGRALAAQLGYRQRGGDARRRFGIGDGIERGFGKHHGGAAALHDRLLDLCLRQRVIGGEHAYRLETSAESGGQEGRAFNDQTALGATQATGAPELCPAVGLRVVFRSDQAHLLRRSSRALRSMAAAR